MEVANIHVDTHESTSAHSRAHTPVLIVAGGAPGNLSADLSGEAQAANVGNASYSLRGGRTVLFRTPGNTDDSGMVDDGSSDEESHSRQRKHKKQKGPLPAKESSNLKKNKPPPNVKIPDKVTILFPAVTEAQH